MPSKYFPSCFGEGLQNLNTKLSNFTKD